MLSRPRYELDLDAALGRRRGAQRPALQLAGPGHAYLSLSYPTVFREVSGGFAHRLTPYVLCGYDVDCEDIADLRAEAGRTAIGVSLADLSCAWADALSARREPQSWAVVRQLLAEGYAGVLTQSFANGATVDDQNLVLWGWGPDLPHKVSAYDPTDKLQKNQLSWT